MKNQPLLYGIIGLLAGSLLTVLFVTNTVNTNNYGMMQMMGIRQGINGSPMVNNLDQHFIEQMIPHHEGAIEMAKMAQERSKRPEILTLAKAIIQSQSQEITQMQAWYKNWYGTEVHVNSTVGMGMGRGMMHGGMMGGQTSDIESLKNAANFDEAFLQEMIPHHEGAIEMAKLAQERSKRPEILTLSTTIIKNQFQ